jgi:hypothetical protein
VVDARQPGPATESTAGSSNPPTTKAVPLFQVDGEAVSEFRALLVGGPGCLITREGGTATIDKVYFDERGFDLGEGPDRAISGLKVERAHYLTPDGLHLWLTKSWHVFIPSSSLRACYRMA